MLVQPRRVGIFIEIARSARILKVQVLWRIEKGCDKERGEGLGMFFAPLDAGV